MDKLADQFDKLEDALASGFPVREDGYVAIDNLAPLMEASRALLMTWRDVPERKTA
jgi:hypothetical protein